MLPAVLKFGVYILCALTAAACVVLLARGYHRSGARLLLWTAICFAFLALHSVVVLIELMIFPSTDLQMVRHAASLAAGLCLVTGLVWESE